MRGIIASVNHINGDAAKSDMCPLPFPSPPPPFSYFAGERGPSVRLSPHILCRTGHTGDDKKEWKRFYSVSISRKRKIDQTSFGRWFFPFRWMSKFARPPRPSLEFDLPLPPPSKKGASAAKNRKKREESKIGLWEKELGKGMMTPPPSLFFSFRTPPLLSLLFLLPSSKASSRTASKGEDGGVGMVCVIQKYFHAKIN